MIGHTHTFTTPDLALINIMLLVISKLPLDAIDQKLSIIAHIVAIVGGIVSLICYLILNRKKIIERWNEWRQELKENKNGKHK